MADAHDRSSILWFRHTGESEPGDDWRGRRPEQHITDREIDERLRGQHTITHMIISDDSISDLGLERATQLKHLMIKRIRSGELSQRLIRWIGRLTHLQSLSLCSNASMSRRPSVLPDSAVWPGLENLVKLEVRGYNFSDGLPPLVVSLSQLHTLTISRCILKELPDRVAEWGGLTELKLEYCDFSDGLPPLFMSLSQLHTLTIYKCKLKELPDSMKQLVCLRKIDLTGNNLETLPSSVFSFPYIELINLANNYNLKYLSSSKLEMSRLQKLPELVLWRCDQLRQPPLQVCLQGAEAILNYYTAMGKDDSCLLSLLTVGVLGESFSGKTSVVKSLKEGKRILTQRSKTPGKDETTIVFNHETVDIHDGKTDIRVIDLGGNGVYHPAYKVTLKSNFIPALVVNIKRYMDLSIKNGREEATRRLCFDWLAHFYLANKKLGRPLLVLTHKDELSANQEQQKEMTNEYRDILLKTVAQLQQGANMMLLEDKTESIFEDVFIVGNDDSFDEFQRLLRCIENRTHGHLYEFPDAWKAMMKKIEVSEEPYLKIEYLKGIFSDSTLLVIMLRFMHRSGRILWLEDLSEDIANKIFHNIQQVTHTIAILFNHNNPERWEHRKVEYLTERNEARGGIVGDAEVPPMIYRYQKTGMIDERLLSYLINKESNIPVEDALTLMKTFLLIYGPKQENGVTYYAVPYFSTSYLNNQWKHDGDISLRLSLRLDCPYALPQHAYHQISLLLASLDCNHNSPLEVKRNGATIYHDGWKTHFIHDHNNSEATLQASTSIEKLTESWSNLRTSVRAILEFLSRKWEAVCPRCIFFCGSCLLTDKLRPDKYVDPSWCDETVADGCSGAQMVHCDEEGCEVPACLVRPCDLMSADELESLRSYIHHHLYKSTADGNPVAITGESFRPCTPAQPTQQEEAWEMPRELYELMKNSANADIILTPHQTPEYLQELYFNTDKVYPMSGGKRGRALIICNKCSSYLRRGAEQDFINLKRMFESFHFDVVGEHKDYTAQEMHDTIVGETEELRHHRYGMFALVITSHGNDGLVYGNDNHSIRLCDIYGLLSATKFPAMKGNPKLVVIQACPGDMMDAPAELSGYKKLVTRMMDKTPITVSTAADTAAVSRRDQAQGESSRDTDTQNNGQTSSGAASDASSSSYTEPNLRFGSIRHLTNGSWLIRAIVLTFYKHGHWRDLEELCVMARDQVRLMSIANSEEKGEARGQIPDLTCTFTNGRSVYLFPGYHG